MLRRHFVYPQESACLEIGKGERMRRHRSWEFQKTVRKETRKNMSNKRQKFEVFDVPGCYLKDSVTS